MTRHDQELLEKQLWAVTRRHNDRLDARRGVFSRPSAFGGKADMPFALRMSAFDPKRTLMARLWDHGPTRF
jgi:hypothetical protein